MSKPSQLDLLLEFILKAIHHEVDLNRKLLRDILDVVEGLSRGIVNRKKNYDHTTLKFGASYISNNALILKSTLTRSECIKATHREHAIPLKVLVPMLYQLKPKSLSELRQFLENNLVSVLITKEERDLLDRGQNSLKDCMPSGWDGDDILSRFNFHGIKIICQPIIL